jgi:hypothetical protein
MVIKYKKVTHWPDQHTGELQWTQIRPRVYEAGMPEGRYLIFAPFEEFLASLHWIPIKGMGSDITELMLARTVSRCMQVAEMDAILRAQDI